MSWTIQNSKLSSFHLVISEKSLWIFGSLCDLTRLLPIFGSLWGFYHFPLYKQQQMLRKVGARKLVGIIVHEPKYCRRFLTNQKELSAKINCVSFLCKRVCRKNIRIFIESQSSTRLDHPRPFSPVNHMFVQPWHKNRWNEREIARRRLKILVIIQHTNIEITWE